MTSSVELAPGIASFIEQSNEDFPPNYRDFSLAEQRAMYGAVCRRFGAPRPPDMVVEDRRIAAGQRDIPVRLYRPAGIVQPSACLLYLHGGGWIYGDLDSHDRITADLAQTAGVTVVAVGYRLAPEHPYPAGLEDCWDALMALSGDPEPFGVDPSRLAVGGDSAGGNLAAALCLKAREAGGPSLCGQILIYPALGLGWDDLKLPADSDDAPMLAADEVLYYVKAYLGSDEGTEDPLAAPLLADDLYGLPPAYVMAAEHDPLVADAEHYAKRLAECAVPVELDVEAGLVHGCLRARDLSPAAADSFDKICRATSRFLQA